MFYGVCLSVASVSASGDAKDLSLVSDTGICICPCSCLAEAHNDKMGPRKLVRALRLSYDRSCPSAYDLVLFCGSVNAVKLGHKPSSTCAA